MNINEIRLELLEMAEEFDSVVYDNGPMGESRPYTDKARRLRNLARELKGVGGNSGNERYRPSPSDDFRDAPWEPR